MKYSYLHISCEHLKKQCLLFLLIFIKAHIPFCLETVYGEWGNQSRFQPVFDFPQACPGLETGMWISELGRVSNLSVSFELFWKLGQSERRDILWMQFWIGLDCVSAFLLVLCIFLKQNALHLHHGKDFNMLAVRVIKDQGPNFDWLCSAFFFSVVYKIFWEGNNAIWICVRTNSFNWKLKSSRVQREHNHILTSV